MYSPELKELNEIYLMRMFWAFGLGALFERWLRG